MIDYPTELDALFDALKKNSLRPVIVGGFIRDTVLKIESKDIDIEVYGAVTFKKLEEILKEFGTVNVVGKSFGVCKLKFEGYDLDFSFPRRDNKTRSGHRGFDVEINPDLDFKTAASRRDFTINAIGYDVVEKKLLDPFGGLDDLKKKILRAVNLKSFIEDPLRVLRAAQFCARFHLEIEHGLYCTCKDMVSKGLLSELPKERVFEEIKKLLLKSQRPSIGFKLLKEFGIDIYTDNLHVIDEMSKHLRANAQTNLVLMLAALCYTMQKAEIENFLFRLTNEKEILKKVIRLIQAYYKISMIDDVEDYFLYKLAMKVKIEELLILSSSIYYANNSSKAYELSKKIYKRAKELNILQKKLPPILHGKELLEFGLKPSPIFSEILDEAYEAQMHGRFKNHSEALLWLKEYLKL